MVDYQENEMKSLKKKNKILNDRINELEGNPSGDAEETRKKAITRAASLHDEAQKISYDEAYKAVRRRLLLSNPPSFLTSLTTNLPCDS